MCVSVNVNETWSVCLLVCMHVCVCMCWLSMKEKSARVLVYPIKVLTQLFVLQGLKCLPAKVLKCQPRQQTITFIPRLQLCCHNNYNTLLEELTLSKRPAILKITILQTD